MGHIFLLKMCMSGLPPSARRVHLPAVPCRSKCCVCVLLELEQHSHPTHPPPAEQGKNSTQHISNDPRQNVPTSELTKSATTGSSGLFWSQPWGSIFQGVAGENECPYSSYSKHILCITMALQWHYNAEARWAFAVAFSLGVGFGNLHHHSETAVDICTSYNDQTGIDSSSPVPFSQPLSFSNTFLYTWSSKVPF